MGSRERLLNTNARKPTKGRLQPNHTTEFPKLTPVLPFARPKTTGSPCGISTFSFHEFTGDIGGEKHGFNRCTVSTGFSISFPAWPAARSASDSHCDCPND